MPQQICKEFVFSELPDKGGENLRIGIMGFGLDGRMVSGIEKRREDERIEKYV